MGGAYPELGEQARGDRHVARRRGGGLRAHARPGHGDARRADRAGARGRALIACRRSRSSACTTPTASRYEMTRELLAEAGLVDRGRLRRADGGAARRAAARGTARGGAAAGARRRARRARSTAAAPTRFTGYETEEQPTTVVAVRALDGADAPTGSGGRQRPARAAGQARRVAVLRRRRRPGLGRRA